MFSSLEIWLETKNKFLKDIKFFLVFLFFVNIFSYSFAISNADQENKNIQNKEVSLESNIIISDIAKAKIEKIKDGSILIIGYDVPVARKGEAEKDAGKLAKNVKDYFLYWLKYWNLTLKFLSTEGFEKDLRGEKERLSIIIVDNEFFQNSVIYEKFQNLVNKIRDKEGVIVSKDGRNINIDLDLVFDEGAYEIKNSASYILDVIVDIIKLSNKNLGLKIAVYKNKAYDKGGNDKEILNYLKKVAKIFVDNGEKESNIYLFPAEMPTLKEKSIEIIFFDKPLNDEAITKYLDQKEGILKKKILGNKKDQDFVIQRDFGEEASFYPTGWMGDSTDIVVDFNCTDPSVVYRGASCIKIEYKAAGSKGWVGLQWQYPPNNWGNRKEGFDLTGKKKLVFYAKGKNGGEKIAECKVGGIKGQYGDSDFAWIGNIRLTNEWKKYEILLTDKDLSHIIGGFSFILTKYDNRYGAVIFLDDICFE